MATIINQFEEKVIKNNSLPVEWQSESALNELEEFLQENWNQRKALYNDEELYTKQQFLGFTSRRGISTKNYVGTVVFKGQQLNIYPKMFREEKEDDDTSELDLNHLMGNLIQWLEYCSKFEFPYINIKSELKGVDNLKELFITVFVKNLTQCFERSGYFQYEEKTEDLSSIKGRFDIKDYYTRKYANGVLDKFQCIYSSFEFDNLLNRIIKYTCKKIITDTRPSNQKAIRSILTKLSDVEDVRCTPKDCDKVKLGKMHANYRIILSMCKMFLLNSTSTYTVDNAESFCFLFPTELLFEGFIGGFIQDVIGGQGKVKLQASEMDLIDSIIIDGKEISTGGFNMKHDILCDLGDKGIFVLDTKYKQIQRLEGNTEQEISHIVNNEVSQSDLYQVITYASKRNTDKAYLLYPTYRFEDIETKTPIMKSKVKDKDGVEKEINVHVVRLPFVFEDDIDKVKSNLKQVIEGIFA